MEELYLERQIHLLTSTHHLFSETKKHQSKSLKLSHSTDSGLVCLIRNMLMSASLLVAICCRIKGMDIDVSGMNMAGDFGINELLL
jgi:hypothetical protein